MVDILFLILKILGGLAAIVVLIKAIVALNRWWSRGRRPLPTLATEETLSAIDTKLGRIVEYFDGLNEAAPEIRDPFDDGRKLQKENKYAEAINQYEACFQTETSASQRAALHILIGNCFFSLSELEEAEGHYRQAETAAKEADDKEGLASALGNIGLIYQTRGELDKALEYHQQSLKINEEIGRKEGEASQLGSIGLIYQTRGEMDKALDYHQQSLKIEREIGRKEGQAQDLGNIGNIYQTKVELDKALDYYQQSLKIFEEIGAKFEIEQTKRNIQKIRKRMKSSRGQKSDAV